MIKDLTPEERKTLMVWGVIGVIIFIVAIIFKLFVIDNTDDKKYNDSYQIVRDHSRYYIVSASLTKYYSFINAKNYKSVLNILDDNYKTSNNITEDNITNFITKSDISMSYKTGVMCSKEVSEGIVNYLVEGTEVGMNTLKEMDVKYYEVVLDGNNITFSIKPIEQSVYEGECHE